MSHSDDVEFALSRLSGPLPHRAFSGPMLEPVAVQRLDKTEAPASTFFSTQRSVCAATCSLDFALSTFRRWVCFSLFIRSRCISKSAFTISQGSNFDLSIAKLSALGFIFGCPPIATMSEPVPVPFQPEGPQRGRGRGRGGNWGWNRGRGRGGRGGPSRGGYQQPQRPDENTQTPATQAPATQTPATQTPATQVRDSGANESAAGPSTQAQQAATPDVRDPAPQRGGRGSRRGGRGFGQRSMVVSHRSRPVPGVSPAPAPPPPGLSADAPDFVPGQPVMPTRNLK